MIFLRRHLPLLLLLAATSLRADISDEIAAVERIRGLRFTAPVKTLDINRSELPVRLREQFTKTLPYPVEQFGDVLRALRLVPENEKTEALISSLLSLYQAQVLAYYDPPSKTFFRVRQLPPMAKDLEQMSGTLAAGVDVHELTHALQDQHFQLGERDIALRDDTDANLALHALVEGEASLVMLAYMIESAGGSFDDMIKGESLTGALSAAGAVDLGAEAPPYFAEMLKFPYVDGLKFVIAAYRRGGWKELDRVYLNPPQSTREILHPDDYFARRFAPAPFAASPALAVPQLLSVEHLGEWHWRFLAGEKNAQGWVSDRVTIAENQLCQPTVLVETMWDSDARAVRFRDAYTRFLEQRGDGVLSRVSGGSVRVAYGADLALMKRFIAQ